ncbi:hypothetical protein [Niabella aquatica]
MYKNDHSGKASLKFILKNMEMVAPNICFTGDAITSLSNYTAKRTVVNMDEWDWHKELREGTIFYIITKQKKTNV